MGFGPVFMIIIGIFLWIFIVILIVRSRKNRHTPSAHEVADEAAVDKIIEAEVENARKSK